MKKRYYLIEAKSVKTSLMERINNPTMALPYDLTLRVTVLWHLIQWTTHKRVYLGSTNIENAKQGQEITNVK